MSSGGEAFVARLWATRKIGVLLAQARQSGANQEVIDEIVKLSLDYGIVTPYTSYLVQEPGLVQEPPANNQDSGGAAPMDATAQAETKAAVEGAAYAAASGEEAVVAAKVRDELQNAVQVAENHAVRFVAGRSFSQQGVVITPTGVQLPLWVDTRFTAKMQVTTVSFGSDCYFKLAARPELTQWLALSSELLIVLDDDHALRITSAQVASAAVGAKADKIAGCPTDLPKN